MTVNFGIIGMGYWGPNYIRVLNSLKGSNLLWCSDIDKTKSGLLKNQGTKFTDNYKDILNDHKIDAVVIATPTSTHYRIVMDALNAGKHVLVEKPVTTDSGQAAELAGLAAGKGLKLLVAHTFLFNPGIKKIKEYIESGVLGDVVYFDSQRRGLGPIRQDVNALWDLAPHDISILLNFMGKTPKRLIAKGRCFVRKDREDVVFIIAEYGDGAIAKMHLSWLDPYKIRDVTVVGSKKMAVFDDVSNERVKIFDKGVELPPFGSYSEFKDAIRDGDILIPKVDNTEPLRAECEHFIDCIENNKEPISNGQTGVNVVRVLEAAQKSLKSGDWVVLPA